MGKTHPSTLAAVMNIASAYENLKEHGKAKELYQRALEGFGAQLGKDHVDTNACAFNLGSCYANSGHIQKLRVVLEQWPHILVEFPAFKHCL